MATIGTFLRNANGYTGAVRTLALNIKARITPVDGDNDRSPDFRIVSDNLEIGAAWKRTARESQREYLSVKLDDPSFAAPIFCSLVATDNPDVYNLIWNRPGAN
jgi:uncharacterized protein (DUF736 family)